jgi:hypothetical protein
MSLNANALTTLVKAKNLLQIPDTTYDVILELLINAISTLFDRSTSRNLKYAEYPTIYLDGNGEKAISLPDFPVASIGSVTEDDIVLTEGTTSDYLLYSYDNDAYLYKMSGVWTTARKGIKLTTFKAGFKLENTVCFDSGSTEPAVGVTLVGATSAATGVITKVIVSGGVWGSDSARGEVEFASITGAFVDNENINISGGASNIMSVDQPTTPVLIPADLELVCLKQVAWEWKKYKGVQWGESSHSFEAGSISIEIDNLLPDVKEVLGRYRKITR